MLGFKRIEGPAEMTMVRCRECKRLLSVEDLKEGSCKCGRREMQSAVTLGLIEYVKIRFFGFNPVLVGGSNVPEDAEQITPVRM